MTEIGLVGNRAAALSGIRPAKAVEVQGQSAAAATGERGADSAQFSERAQLLSKLAGLPDVRQDVVARAKANIQAGAYDTDAVLDATVDALSDDL